MHHWVTESFPFLGFSLPVQDLHGDFVSPSPHTKWQHKMASHVKYEFFSEPHAHAFSCQPKRCSSQIY